MKCINATTIGKLIEAHIEHDERKFLSYANFIAEAYEEAREERSARIIRSKLDGTYKNQAQVVLDCDRVIDKEPNKMNLLEHHIQQIYSVEDVTKRFVEKTGTQPKESLLKVKMRVNCYGNKSEETKMFFQSEWEETKRNGYYMA